MYALPHPWFGPRLLWSRLTGMPRDPAYICHTGIDITLFVVEDFLMTQGCIGQIARCRMHQSLQGVVGVMSLKKQHRRTLLPCAQTTNQICHLALCMTAYTTSQ